uniref:Uncharacterized protein n=1 Tax=Amphimedon queenslandica TaxID=400682 RepID=A0A1X7T5V6_AMPQE
MNYGERRSRRKLNNFKLSVYLETSIDVVDSVRAPTGEDHKHEADSDPLFYQQNPSQSPTSFDANAGIGGRQSDADLCTGYESFDYETKSLCGTLVEDIIISLDVHPQDAEMITQRKFWDVILHQKIPVTTCLVAFMGLPCTGKTTAIEGMFKEFIKLKEGSTFSFDDYMKRKRNDECLSIYELCVLGGLPHDEYAWSFATNRYGAINLIICSLARQYPSITEAVFESAKKKPSESFVDKHVQWLMAEVSNHLGKIKEERMKLSLIQDGISLINVMDVGVNKAIYDFLSIMLLSCKRHFRV